MRTMGGGGQKMQTSFKYGPGEEFFTQTDRDSAVVKNIAPQPLDDLKCN